MSLSAKLIITGDAAQRIRAIAAQLKRPEAMWKELCRVGAITIREHFVARDAEPNKTSAAGSLPPVLIRSL